MNIPSQAIIDVLTFLLPGFVSAAILHSLTPAPRLIPFERVVQALIFTIVIQAGTSGVKTGLIGIGPQFGSIGVWSEETMIVWSLVLAGLLGVVLAWIDNTDQLHSRLRKLRITHQTSFSSEWYGALSQARGYLVLTTRPFDGLRFTTRSCCIPTEMTMFGTIPRDRICGHMLRSSLSRTG